jgi:hypothetical protein
MPDDEKWWGWCPFCKGTICYLQTEPKSIHSHCPGCGRAGLYWYKEGILPILSIREYERLSGKIIGDRG